MVVPIDYFRYICDYNQIKMSNITKKELETLRELNQKIAVVKNSIADECIKMFSSEPLRSALNKYNEIMQVAKDLNDFNDELESKYGPINVNKETGEYASQEDSSGK